jgi:hypothetical protein
MNLLLLSSSLGWWNRGKMPNGTRCIPNGNEIFVVLFGYDGYQTKNTRVVVAVVVLLGIVVLLGSSLCCCCGCCRSFLRIVAHVATLHTMMRRRRIISIIIRTLTVGWFQALPSRRREAAGGHVVWFDPLAGYIKANCFIIACR